MPQMSPMMWMVYPFVMIFVMMVIVATLNGEVNVMLNGGFDSEKKLMKVKW